MLYTVMVQKLVLILLILSSKPTTCRTDPIPSVFIKGKHRPAITSTATNSESFNNNRQFQQAMEAFDHSATAKKGGKRYKFNKLQTGE